MCTLTTQFGITWNIVRLSGKTAFIHNRMVVVQLPDRHHHFIAQGKSVASYGCAGDCLDAASEMILDAYASSIIPSWDDPEATLEIVFEDEEPITERYPANYIPNWAEAAA
jgi:hypothetical protein